MTKQEIIDQIERLREKKENDIDGMVIRLETLNEEIRYWKRQLEEHQDVLREKDYYKQLSETIDKGTLMSREKMNVRGE